MSEQLWEWWEGTPTQAQRDNLMDVVYLPLDPDLALKLWRSSGALILVVPEKWSTDTDPERWHLTDEVLDFVAAREYDRRHPEDD